MRLLPKVQGKSFGRGGLPGRCVAGERQPEPIADAGTDDGLWAGLCEVERVHGDGAVPRFKAEAERIGATRKIVRFGACEDDSGRVSDVAVALGLPREPGAIEGEGPPRTAVPGRHCERPRWSRG